MSHLALSGRGKVGLLDLGDDSIVRRRLRLDVANLGHDGIQLLEKIVKRIGISHGKGGG